MLTSEFDYDLPTGSIAQIPAEPRDSSRLLDTTTMSDHVFSDLPGVLSRGDLVVVNRTRVQRARLLGQKEGTGGRVEALLLRPLDAATWQAMVKPARRLRAGSTIDFGGARAEVVAIESGVAILRLDAEDAMSRAGQVPLPPYIERPLADPERYQTMFANEAGSAAASTAALHFTERVTEELAANDIEIAELVLHIGLDTFRPITSDQIDQHVIHTERFFVPEATAEAIGRCRVRGGRIVAIGTTVVRTLESAALSKGTVEPGAGDTTLYITPGHDFRVVDALVTNFHLPRTSLLVMLAAFMGPGWRDAYSQALARGYRFASFGDSMYAERLP